MDAIGIPKERMQSWQWQQFYTYARVKPGTDISQLQLKFQKAIIKDVQPEMKTGGSYYLPFFQPLKNIHLQSSDFVYDNSKRGNITYVKGLSLIALFVLLIACFNFINLATARSVRRAKEIGVRKVIGAERKQLFFQFTGESVLMALMSVILSIAASLFIIPQLNKFAEKTISFNLIANPMMVIGLLAGGIMVGILAGIYPAVILSSFKPVKVLKGLMLNSENKGNTILRKALVITQFSLSALLIICTLIVYKQLSFLHQKDLGFNKDQVMYFTVQGQVAKDPAAFKNEIKQFPGVIAATAGYGLPGDQFAGDNIIVTTKEGDKTFPANQFMVDEDYIKTLGLHIAAGRDFSKEFATDKDEAFIINETAVKELGFGTAANALGKPLKWPKWDEDSLHPNKEGKIIGVVKDFHVKSLHEKVATTVLQIYPGALYKMAVKINTSDLPATIASIKSAWNKFSPEYPLDYNFLDENFEKMYKAEDKLGSLLWIFTLMAIAVGCLGLFGLAAYTAEQARKEIGIRKVLGATVAGIVTMLSKKFLQPVLIASLIAFPIAYMLMDKWLQNFPYRIKIGWTVFLVSTLAALFIALATVSFQSIKAAVANPVKSLKTE
jgi:putative ABC transport system permease protein